MDNVRAHERSLTRYALDLLPREVPGIRIHGPRSADERAGIVTFNLPDVHPHDVATLLDREAIAIRAGHHCTQPLHERLGEAATARASFNVYSTTDDLDRLAAGLRKVQRIFSRDVAADRHPRRTADPDHVGPCGSHPRPRASAAPHDGTPARHQVR